MLNIQKARTTPEAFQQFTAIHKQETINSQLSNK
jgi:hypothetical protein